MRSTEVHDQAPPARSAHPATGTYGGVHFFYRAQNQLRLVLLNHVIAVLGDNQLAVAR
jgi:hypothetical protein